MRRFRTMPSTALLLAMLAAILILAARLYAAPHPRRTDQIPGLTYEAQQRERRQPIALVVTSVEDDGPAARAQIATGDIIDRLDGQPIASVAAIGAMLRRDARQGITLRVRHDGQIGYKHLPAVHAPVQGRPHVTKDSGGRG